VRTYEVVFVAAPTMTTEELDAFINHIRTVAESKNGKILKVDNWGKKPLAYRIKRFRDAYYVIITMEGEGATIAELERRFRVTDTVIRFISVRIDEDLKRSEKLKATRQKKSGAKQAQQPQAGGIEPEAAPM